MVGSSASGITTKGVWYGRDSPVVGEVGWVREGAGDAGPFTRTTDFLHQDGRVVCGHSHPGRSPSEAGVRTGLLDEDSVGTKVLRDPSRGLRPDPVHTHTTLLPDPLGPYSALSGPFPHQRSFQGVSCRRRTRTSGVPRSGSVGGSPFPRPGTVGARTHSVGVSTLEGPSDRRPPGPVKLSGLRQ